MLQMILFNLNPKGLLLPVCIECLRIDPRVLLAESKRLGENPILEAVFDFNLDIGVTKGLEYRGGKASLVNRNLNYRKPYIGYYDFEAYINHQFVYNNQKDLLEYSRVCDRLAEEISINIKKEIDLELITNSVHFVNSIDSKKNKSLFYLLKDIYEYRDQRLIDSVIDWQRKSLLANDMICDAYNCQTFVETLLGVVYENKSSPEIKIREINSSSPTMESEILKVFDFHDYSCRINYKLIDLWPQLISTNLTKDMDLKQLEQNWSAICVDLSDTQLVVHKDLSVSLQPIDKQNVNLKQIFELLYNKLKPNAFILIVCREELTFAEQFLCKHLDLNQITVKRTQVIAEAEKSRFALIGNYSDVFSVNALLFRKTATDIDISKQIFIKMTNKFEDWMEKLQNELKSIHTTPEDQNIWLLSKSVPINGILGFYNCIRKETNGNRIRIIFNINKNPNNSLLNINNSYLNSIVRQDLRINIIKDKQLGYFRVKPMKAIAEPVVSEHCFLNTATKGDLSSFKWFECQHKYWPIGRRDNEILCEVYYSALNFKDVMLATGRLHSDSLNDCILGLEFSGRDENGNRVMGLIASKALATTCIVDNPHFLWPIPDHWSMEEAATVPCVYATAYYALIIRGKLKEREKVLIHSGSGGVGQAAINICLSLDCQLFITVGSDAKRDFLKNLFPKLTDRNFSSSRDLGFKTHVMKETNGLGIDVILNSLSEEKLKASLECLANNGRFLEIGKYDMSVNTRLDICELLRNKTFHGILLDSLFELQENTSKLCIKEMKTIWRLIKGGISEGIVKPLNRTIFSFDKCEEAFRFMASGRHIGKVVVRIRAEEVEKKFTSISRPKISAIPRTVFHSNNSYVITRGLGGMGLELIDWMIERGAKLFVVTSRSGPKDSYQLYKLKYFADCSATVLISNEDISRISGAESLLRLAQSLAPIGGIFHLQMILNDGLFENQTLDSFRKVCQTKSTSFANLDSMSRNLCPDVEHFVGFSSIASTYGNRGQTNYGYSNSVVERVCDLRKADGLQALAIQWGIVGDVGYFEENMNSAKIELIGSIAQSIESCLKFLDRALQSKHSICTSYVRSDVKLETKEGKTDLMKSVAHILGLDDYSKLDLNTKLVKLGMDSLMTVEIKQIIERDFNVVLNTEDIRELTIATVQKINSVNNSTDGQKSSPSLKKQLNEDIFRINEEKCIQLNNVSKGKFIFFIPPQNGSFHSVLKIASSLLRPAYGLNWTENCLHFESLQDLSAYYLHLIQTNFPLIDMNFDLIGYSFGGIIAYEMSLQLQYKWSRNPRLVLLDSSPIQFKLDLQTINETVLNRENIRQLNNELIEIYYLIVFLLDKTRVKYESMEQLLKSLPKEHRMAKVCDILIEKTDVKCERKQFEFAVTSHIKKMLLVYNYSNTDLSLKKFKGDLVLLRAKQHWIIGAKREKTAEEDYGLNQIVSGNCRVITFNGEHETFLDDNSDAIIDFLNNCF